MGLFDWLKNDPTRRKDGEEAETPYYAIKRFIEMLDIDFIGYRTPGCHGINIDIPPRYRISDYSMERIVAMKKRLGMIFEGYQRAKSYRFNKEGDLAKDGQLTWLWRSDDDKKSNHFIDIDPYLDNDGVRHSNIWLFTSKGYEYDSILEQNVECKVAIRQESMYGITLYSLYMSRNYNVVYDFSLQLKFINGKAFISTSNADKIFDQANTGYFV